MLIPLASNQQCIQIAFKYQNAKVFRYACLYAGCLPLQLYSARHCLLGCLYSPTSCYDPLFISLPHFCSFTLFFSLYLKRDTKSANADTISIEYESKFMCIKRLYVNDFLLLLFFDVKLGAWGNAHGIGNFSDGFLSFRQYLFIIPHMITNQHRHSKKYNNNNNKILFD